MLKIVTIVLVVVTKLRAHVPVNSSDVIIYAGHADLHDQAVFITTARPESTKPKTTLFESQDFMELEKEKAKEEEQQKEDVLFVPTEGDTFRIDNLAHEDTVRMSDVISNKKTLGSLMRETEAPQDILFISGKNNERQERPGDPEERGRDSRYGEGGRRGMDYDDELETTTKRIRLNCKKLNCDNNIASVCGARKERSAVKYRLFLNECYFRKVNCAFTSKLSRYEQVDVEMCKNIAAHAPKKTDIHYQYYPEKPSTSPRSKLKSKESARRMNGRRSMTMNYVGGYCGHECPKHCPEDQEPECALNADGERRVFANHCMLDRASCQFQMIWRRRPLSECVGGKMADMHQNRGFINWMQQVGIVDKKGKLVLN